MEVSEKIKTIRKALGLTQSAFAKGLKCSSGYITLIESGDRQPSDTLVALLKKQYCVENVWWETGKGEMFSSSVREHSEGYGERRKLDPEEEKLLTLLQAFPEAKEMMEAFLQLPVRKQKIQLGKVLEELEKLEEEEK